MTLFRLQYLEAPDISLLSTYCSSRERVLHLHLNDLRSDNFLELAFGGEHFLSCR